MNNLVHSALSGHRGLSGFLARACLALAIALPVLTLYGLSTTSVETWLTKLGVPASQLTQMSALDVAPWQTGLAWLLGMLPVCAMAYGLLRARLCFLGFRRGEIFSRGTVRHLGGLASGVFGAAVAGLLVPPFVSVLLTLNAPSGTGALVLRISSNEVLLLLFAGIVWQIAHVMTKAVELADEHAQIV